MQPALGRERREPVRQLRRLELADLRIPDDVDARRRSAPAPRAAWRRPGRSRRCLRSSGRSAPRRAGVGGGSCGAGRRSRRRRRAIAPAVAAQRRAQDLLLGRMELERAQLVVRAQQHLRQRRRARVLGEHAVGIEAAHQRDVVGERLPAGRCASRAGRCRARTRRSSSRSGPRANSRRRRHGCRRTGRPSPWRSCAAAPASGRGA